MRWVPSAIIDQDMKTTRSSLKHSDFARDFSATTRRELLKRWIAVIGIKAIPDMSHPMPYANASRGYELSNNGTFMIRTHAEVIAMAAA